MPACITRALGGVEKGDAKHMLAARVTAKSMGSGLTPSSTDALMAIGAISTAVAVLLINIVSREVVKYIPQSNAMGPTVPSEATRV